MAFDRRHFLRATGVGVGSLSLLNFSNLASQPRRDLPRPDPSLLQSGDFVWPKKPGAYVPYNVGSLNGPEQDRSQWIAERNAYLGKITQVLNPDPVVLERINALRSMDYREFIAVYAGAQTPGIPGLYLGGGVYVGHVGIIEVDARGEAWVIEALMEKGVVRSKYLTWLEHRSDQVIWLARLRQLDGARRALVVHEAKKHLGRPYDFWNFDLNDDSVFYCSKLVWLSVFRSLGFAVDGEEKPRRVIWFSPKQLLNLPVLEKLHDPGPYANV